MTGRDKDEEMIWVDLPIHLSELDGEDVAIYT